MGKRKFSTNIFICICVQFLRCMLLPKEQGGTDIIYAGKDIGTEKVFWNRKMDIISSKWNYDSNVKYDNSVSNHSDAL